MGRFVSTNQKAFHWWRPSHYVTRFDFKCAVHAGTILPALWKLADFMQSTDLCEELLAYLSTNSLRSGTAFGVWIENSLREEANPDVKAALLGLPTKPDISGQEDHAPTSNKPTERDLLVEVWLDDGSSYLLQALVRCQHFWRSDQTLCHEYLPEMTADHRNQMDDAVRFAEALLRMQPGTI